jgi:hypothetical protein
MSFPVKLTEEQHQAVKIVCAMRQMTMYAWFGEALEAFVKWRAEKEEEGNKDAVVYQAGPARGKQVSGRARESVVEEFRRCAKSDNVHLRHAYYTAIVAQLEADGEEDLELHL